MVLEASVICLDNSEWMRNGDYAPSRIEAQQDAVNIICAAKTQQNPESTVAVMTMAQSKGIGRAEVLVTLTQDLGKILQAVHSVRVGGESDFSSAMQIAQLVLKHRQNKNQHQRIVCFVGSPLKESSDDLVKLAKRMKKNNIAVDIVNFGEETQNVAKLESFRNAVNNPNEESHLVNVPPGPHILSDMLVSTPIIGGGGFGASAAASAAVAAVTGGVAGGDFEFGIDPTLDPELAMAIRLSMEEERARQAAAAQQTKPSDEKQQEATATVADVEMADYGEDDLKRAMELSMGAGAGAGGDLDASAMDLSEEEKMELEMALKMSVDASQATATPAPAADATSLQDQDFLNSVLQSLPGVDPNDERIRRVLSSMGGEKKEEGKDKEKK